LSRIPIRCHKHTRHNAPRMNDKSALPNRPFREEYFPGDHGSVGGGGDIVKLSNIALTWILEGAMQRKLSFDAARIQTYEKASDPINAPLTNFSEPRTGIRNWLTRLKLVDRPGPKTLAGVHIPAKQRWSDTGTRDLPKPYRPKTLAHLENDILAWYKDTQSDPSDDTRIT